MMKQLVFASGNASKVREVEQKMGTIVPLLGLKDIGCTDDIPETGNTLEANARMKAWYVWNKYQVDCFADDTGLEIEVLNNEPGVFSARYAGEQRNSEDNMSKVLSRLAGNENRKARFRTVICLITQGQEQLFEGIVEGAISKERRGEEGFGYDPIFIPNSEARSFAQMTLEEKNTISHRGRAIKKLALYLESIS